MTKTTIINTATRKIIVITAPNLRRSTTRPYAMGITSRTGTLRRHALGCSNSQMLRLTSRQRTKEGTIIVLFLGSWPRRTFRNSTTLYTKTLDSVLLTHTKTLHIIKEARTMPFLRSYKFVLRNLRVRKLWGKQCAILTHHKSLGKGPQRQVNTGPTQLCLSRQASNKQRGRWNPPLSTGPTSLKVDRKDWVE